MMANTKYIYYGLNLTDNRLEKNHESVQKS